MRFSANNLGLLLAVVAGVVSIAFSTWPGAPQYTVFESALWVLFTFLVGIGFIAAAALADSHTMISRILLIGGAGLRIASAIYFGGWFPEGIAAGLLDFAPALIALLGGIIIGPRESSAIP